MGSFFYKNGCLLIGMDLADDGVKLTLSHPSQDDLAILLPPQKVQELTEWLSKALGHPTNHLPVGFIPMLKRLVRQQGKNIKLKDGDKVRMKEAIKVLSKTEIVIETLEELKVE